jgi:hypothetical protein
MPVLHLTHLRAIQTGDGSVWSSRKFYMDTGVSVFNIEDAARAAAVCVELEIQRSERGRKRGEGDGVDGNSPRTEPCILPAWSQA